MTTKFNVEVTQRHIDTGLKGECAKCPIALAICDSFIGAQLTPPLSVKLFVDYFHALLTVVTHDGKFRLRGKLQREVRKFISEFDWGRQVVPFTFSLTLKRPD